MSDARANEDPSQQAESSADWVRAWIEQQREQLQRFAAPENAELAGQWCDIGRRWLDVIGAWQASAPQFSEVFDQLLSPMSSMGPARERTQAWRDLAAAQSEWQKLEQELRAVLLRVQADALSLLEQRLRESSNGAIGTFRELYDLWVECGEQVYAQVAHSDAYAKLQAQLGNATIQLRARQQQIIEYELKQFDLPTRSELNTVHRQLRELRGKVAALEARLAQAPVDTSEGNRE